MRKKRLISTMSLGLVAAFALAGCGSGSGSGSYGDSAGGGTLTVGAAQGIGKLNPAESGTAWELVLFPLLYDGLVKIGESGDLEPDLATKWTASDDSKSWTFELRPGVKFSNGKALTAQDVA